MTANGVEHVDVRTGEALVRDGALLLDVRTPEEWVAGHAPEATHLPLDEVPVRHHELFPDRVIVVICRSGNRSALAAEALVQAGHRAVNLAGGMLAWIGEGLPCVTDDGRPGTVA